MSTKPTQEQDARVGHQGNADVHALGLAAADAARHGAATMVGNNSANRSRGGTNGTESWGGQAGGLVQRVEVMQTERPATSAGLANSHKLAASRCAIPAARASKGQRTVGCVRKQSEVTHLPMRTLRQPSRPSTCGIHMQDCWLFICNYKQQEETNCAALQAQHLREQGSRGASVRGLMQHGADAKVSKTDSTHSSARPRLASAFPCQHSWLHPLQNMRVESLPR